MTMRFSQCFKPMNVEAFVPHGSVECLDEGVVRRLAPAREVYPDGMALGTEINEMAGEFRAIFSANIYPEAPRVGTKRLNMFTKCSLRRR